MRKEGPFAEFGDQYDVAAKQGAVAPSALRAVAGRGDNRTETRPLGLPAPGAGEHPLSSDIARASKPEAQIREALSQPVDFEIEPQPLAEALDFIAARYQIPILIDYPALEDANVDQSVDVKLNAPGIPLHDALRLLFDQMSQLLRYDVVHEVLMISTADKTNEHFETIVYDCRDLIEPPFIPMIWAGREFWIGDASISEMGGLVILRDRPEAHDNVKALLASIRLMRKDGAFAELDRHSLGPNSNAEKTIPAVTRQPGADADFAPVDHPLSSDLAWRSPIEARIQKALDQPVDFVIKRQSKDALDFIAAHYHIPIVLDQKALDDANVDTSSQVKLNAPGISLRDTLRLLLSQPSQPTTYEVVHSVVMVSTVDKMNEVWETIVYDCRDLLTLPNNKSGHAEKNRDSGALWQALIPTVKSTTGRDAWEVLDGDEDFRICAAGGLLFVRHNPAVQERIKKLLASIRRMRKEGAFAAQGDPHDAKANKPAAGQRELAEPVVHEPPQLHQPKVDKPAINRETATKSPRDQSDESAAAAKRRAANVFRLMHEHPLSSDTGRNPQIEAALGETVNFKIEPQPLQDAIELLAARFHITILSDDKALEDANVQMKQEVSLNAPGITLRDTLNLILGKASAALSFEIRHGTLIVSTVDAINGHREVVVYDCRDLVLLPTLDRLPADKTDPAMRNRGASGGAVVGGGGVFQAAPDAAKPADAPRSVPQSPAGKAPAGGAPPTAAAVPPSKTEAHARLPLVQTIISATVDSWDDEDTSITELGGLIVVRQSPLVHEAIKDLLADIRRMRADGAFASFAKEYEAEAKRRDEAEAAGRPSNAGSAERASSARKGERAVVH
jgi:hypothetical protein